MAQLSTDALHSIASPQLVTIVLEESATHIHDLRLIHNFLEAVREAVGPMPLQPSKEEEEGEPRKKGLR